VEVLKQKLGVIETHLEAHITNMQASKVERERDRESDSKRQRRRMDSCDSLLLEYVLLRVPPLPLLLLSPPHCVIHLYPPLPSNASTPATCLLLPSLFYIRTICARAHPRAYNNRIQTNVMQRIKILREVSLAWRAVNTHQSTRKTFNCKVRFPMLLCTHASCWSCMSLVLHVTCVDSTLFPTNCSRKT